MLKPPALARAVAEARPRAIAINTVIFRSIHLRHFSNFATVQPLFAARGDSYGTRFVRPNGPTTLYAAIHPATAYLEGNQLFYETGANVGRNIARQELIRSGGLRPAPVVIIGIHLQVSSLLDLQKVNVRLQLGIQTVDEILGPWKGVPHAPTQVLGDAVYRDRHFEGIVYPSVRNSGRPCLVLFPDRLRPTSRIDFSDKDSGLAARLPSA